MNIKTMLALIALPMCLLSYPYYTKLDDPVIIGIGNAAMLEDKPFEKDGVKYTQFYKHPFTSIAKGVVSNVAASKGDAGTKNVLNSDLKTVLLTYLDNGKNYEYYKIRDFVYSPHAAAISPFTNNIYENQDSNKFLFEARPYEILEEHIRKRASGKIHILSWIAILGQMLWDLAVFDTTMDYSYCLPSPRGFGVMSDGRIVLNDPVFTSMRKYCRNGTMANIPPETILRSIKYDAVVDLQSKTAEKLRRELKIEPLMSQFAYVRAEKDSQDHKTDPDSYGAFTTFFILMRHLFKNDKTSFDQMADTFFTNNDKIPGNIDKNSIIQILNNALDNDNVGAISGIEELYMDFTIAMTYHTSKTKYKIFEELALGNFSSLGTFYSEHEKEIEYCNEEFEYAPLQDRKVRPIFDQFLTNKFDEEQVLICSKKELAVKFCKDYSEVTKCDEIKVSASMLDEILLKELCTQIPNRSDFCTKVKTEGFCDIYKPEYAAAVELHRFLERKNLLKTINDELTDDKMNKMTTFCQNSKMKFITRWANEWKRVNGDEEKFKTVMAKELSQLQSTAEDAYRLAIAIQVYEMTVRSYILQELDAYIQESIIFEKNKSFSTTNAGEVANKLAQYFRNKFNQLLRNQTSKFIFNDSINKEALESITPGDECPGDDTSQTYNGNVLRRDVKQAAVRTLNFLIMLNFLTDNKTAAAQQPIDANLKNPELEKVKKASSLIYLPNSCNLHSLLSAGNSNNVFLRFIQSSVTNTTDFVKNAYADFMCFNNEKVIGLDMKNPSLNSADMTVRKALYICNKTIKDFLRRGVFDGIMGSNYGKKDLFTNPGNIYAKINEKMKEILGLDRGKHPEHQVEYVDDVLIYLQNTSKDPFVQITSKDESSKVINRLGIFSRKNSQTSTKDTLPTDDSLNNSTDGSIGEIDSPTKSFEKLIL